jgi:hypothetical protein
MDDTKRQLNAEIIGNLDFRLPSFFHALNLLKVAFLDPDALKEKNWAEKLIFMQITSHL